MPTRGYNIVEKSVLFDWTVYRNCKFGWDEESCVSEGEEPHREYQFKIESNANLFVVGTAN